MIPDQDAGRLIRVWLDDGEPVLPTHVFAAVLDEIPHVRQRRRRGIPGTRNLGGFPAAAAIALLAMLLLGLAVAVGAIIGLGIAPPSPRPFPTGETRLAPGRYVIDRPFPVRIALDVPDGWASVERTANTAELGQDRPGGGALLFTTVEGVYEDPCRYERGLVDRLGPSAADLAVALAGLPGLEGSGPTSIDVSGRPALSVSLQAPTSRTGCTAGDPPFPLWGIPETFAPEPGEMVRLVIVPVDDVRLVIVERMFRTTDSSGEAALEAVMASIRLGVDAPVAADADDPTAGPTATVAAPEPTIAPLPDHGTLRSGPYVGRIQLYRRGPDGRPSPLRYRHDIVLAAPEGWLATGRGIASSGDRSTASSVEAWAIAGIHPDPCRWRTVGATAASPADLDALTSLLRSGWSTDADSAPTASEPRDVPWNGKFAWTLELTIPSALDLARCDDGQLRLWDAPDGGTRIAVPGEHLSLVVIDLDPGLVVLTVGSPPDASLSDTQTLLRAGASVWIGTP